jgi:hypothetical protein
MTKSMWVVVAPNGGCALAGEEIIRRNSAAKGQFQVRVDIDATGKQQLAAGIDHLVAGLRQVATDQCDLLAVDQHIGVIGVAGSDNRPVCDQRSTVFSPVVASVGESVVVSCLALRGGMRIGIHGVRRHSVLGAIVYHKVGYCITVSNRFAISVPQRKRLYNRPELECARSFQASQPLFCTKEEEKMTIVRNLIWSSLLFALMLLAACQPVTAPPAPLTATEPINGIDLYYEVHGQGDPLILIHGGLGNAGYWSNQIPVFCTGPAGDCPRQPRPWPIKFR